MGQMILGLSRTGFAFSADFIKVIYEGSINFL